MVIFTFANVVFLQHPVALFAGSCIIDCVDEENSMSNWVRDGETIVATYMGTRVTGVVESSRVKYGGEVQYTVNLNEPVQLRWRTEPTTRLLIDSCQIIGG